MISTIINAWRSIGITFARGSLPCGCDYGVLRITLGKRMHYFSYTIPCRRHG